MILIVVAARVIDAPIEEAKVAEEKPIESVVEPTRDVPANVEEVSNANSAALVEAAAVAAEEKPVEAAAVEET
jgi:phosphoribosylcarboxyaminoimidazole (NCAIR) mutase